MPDHPAVFVSSTILDFADLRTALKFWLEEAGYTVLLSEFNDFPIEPASDAFENCLSAIEKCNYFLLLIGFRRGSYYDKSSAVTITRAEYRHAYQLALKNQLKVVVCVRSGVLEGLRSGNRVLFEDFDFTSGFVSEVRRETDVKASSAVGGPFPIGNWVRQFDDFRGLVDAVRSSTGISKPLQRKAIEANLTWELKANLQFLLEKHDGGLRAEFERLVKWSETVPISAKKLESEIELTPDQAKQLAWCGVSTLFPNWGHLRTNALEDAVNSGVFLSYSLSSGDFFVGEIQHCLLQLRDEIRKLIRMDTTSSELRDKALCTVSSIHKMHYPRISTPELASILHLANILHNVLALTAGLLAHFRGINTDLKTWPLAPESPLPESARNFQELRPTVEDIDSWIDALFGGK